MDFILQYNYNLYLQWFVGYTVLNSFILNKRFILVSTTVDTILGTPGHDEYNTTWKGWIAITHTLVHT